MKYYIVPQGVKTKNPDTTIELEWGDSISDWIEQSKEIPEGSDVVGYSVGAFIALLLTKEMASITAYSPSPLFKEVVDLLPEEEIEYIGDKYQEALKSSVEDVANKNITIVYGSDEEQPMIDSIHILVSHLQCDAVVKDVENHYSLMKYLVV